MKYEEAARLWGAKRLREQGVVFDEVVHVAFCVNTDVGCPTCGPETSYEATIFYTPEVKRREQYHDVTFSGLDEILRGLFEVSEP